MDEETTAERLAEDPGLPPGVRPGLEPRWNAVLVVDTGPWMAVWRSATLRFAGVLRRYGGFRDLELRRLNTRSEALGDVELCGPGERTRRQPSKALVDPTARRIVFVLTDGLAPAWRSGAAQRLLAVWGRHQPVAVLHSLPQRLWHRTGLFPDRVRLHTSGPRAASGQVKWEFTEPSVAAPLREPGAGRRAVPIPVLEIAGEWIAPWARFVAGEGPRRLDVAAALVGPWRRPEPTAGTPEAVRTPLSAAERVARFRVWASPETFDLATRLAAVPLDLPVMTAVQRRAMPRTGPAHIAEFLMSGLVEPLLGSGDRSFLFHEGVREELLASGTRQATELASRAAAETLAPHDGAARELLTYFDGGEVARKPEVTRENARFRQIEHAVLQALSGSHVRRARQLQELIDTGADRVSSEDLIDPSDSTETAGSARQVSNVLHDAISKGSDAVNHPGMPDTPTSPSQEGVTPTGAQQGGMPVTTVSQRPATTPSTGAGVGVPLDRSSAVSVGRPLIWGNTPPRNMLFTGRDELLRQLERGLSEGPTAVLPHALHGMGGVGKSQLALEYVYLHASEYDVVWWIPAERPTQIAQAMVELAQRLGLPVTGEAITAVPAVLEALRTGNPYSNWLLVFDNAESPEAVQEFFPSSPQGGPTGSIMVTSRNPQWNTLAHPLEVDIFERSESIQLLQRRNPDLPAEEADKLAEVLGDLPLAVEQASAWRAETGMPAAEYLRLFDQKRAELMTVSPPTQYEQTVATAWNVSLDHVENKNRAALQLLQVCAFFASEPISRSLFSGAPVEPIAPDLDRALTDPLRLGRAIREIYRYSLAKIDHRGDSIQMHRLVQAVLVARMSEEQRARMRRGAHLLLAANAPRDPKDPEHWARFGSIYPHVVVSGAVESESRNVRQMVIHIAEYLFYWGDHSGARAFAQHAYDDWCERFGENDQQTLLLLRHLRYVVWTMGRYAEAAKMGQRMLEGARAAGPEGEEELLTVMGQVAADRRAQGDYRGALDLDEDVYARAVRAFGEDDPETLRHAHNLATGLRALGDYRRALELDEETWRRRVETHGDESLPSLMTEMSIAIDRRELGDYAIGAQLFEGVVDKFRRVFGELNPNTLRVMARLAASRRKAGDHSGAIELSKYARKALTERYGQRSPDSLAASLGLSLDLRQTGELNESWRLGEATRDLYVEVFGLNHPNTLAAETDLAITLRLLNNTDAARRINGSALTRARETLPETHPNVLVCAVNLASDLFAQGDAAAALELDETTLRTAVKTLGEDHPTLLALKSNLACDLKALRRYEEANAMHTAVVKSLQSRLGEAHPACADALAWRRANCDLDANPL
ncbi:tetratricopeptide repeat protein [Streptomyces gobiensis]|nr:tetratricopeptide repeat protein [Streptomyces gobiensis]